jgi:type IV pilus assembly protein PilW
MNSIRWRLSQSGWHQRGLSLVEILVALTISLFLIAGVIQLFIGSKQTYRFNDAQSRLQENGRFAIDRMAWDIRMAGYDPDIWAPPLTNAITVASSDEDEDGDDDDEITIQYFNGAGTATLSRRYFIDTGASGRSALFLNDGAASQELVEGVEGMRITPLLCVGGSAGQECGARIDLLLVSLESNLTTEPQTVTWPLGGATTFTAPNRRMSQIFSTTVAIRNRPF